MSTGIPMHHYKFSTHPHRPNTELSQRPCPRPQGHCRVLCGTFTEAVWKPLAAASGDRCRILAGTLPMPTPRRPLRLCTQPSRNMYRVLAEVAPSPWPCSRQCPMPIHPRRLCTQPLQTVPKSDSSLAHAHALAQRLRQNLHSVHG